MTHSGLQSAGTTEIPRAGTTRPGISSKLVLTVMLAAGLSGTAMGRAAAQAPPEVSVAVRAGDIAPAAARAPQLWGCRLAAASSGGTLFVDRQRTALFEAGAQPRLLAHVGEMTSAGTLAEICEAAASGDGSIAFRALLADRREGLFRLPPDGGPIETLLAGGQSLDLRAGPATVARLSGPALDGSGRAVAAVDFVQPLGALVRLASAAPPEVLMQTGDLLDNGEVFQRSPTAAAAAPDGTVAFTVVLTTGAQRLATLAPGGSATVRFGGASTPLPVLTMAPPAINPAGEVAFLWSEGGVIRVQRLTAGGGSETVAAPGSPAPAADTFAAITDLPPAIRNDGAVLFGAYRTQGPGGLYLHLQGPEVVAEEGSSAGNGQVFAALNLYQPQAAPAAAPDGTLHFVASDTLGEALFARSGSQLRVDLRAGDALPVPARFVSFLEASFPVLGGGPFLTAGGRMIFDARLTTGARGLFVRQRDGSLSVVALDGDPAPGGGHLDGRFLSFHTLNDAGTAAFLAAAPDTPGGTSLVLYYGGGAAGALRRVIGVGDLIPGTSVAVSGFQPPSRVDDAGGVAVPVFQPDGTALLLGYDGSRLFRVAGPGDVLPSGRSIATILTGSSLRGIALPPLVEEAGRVTFGVVADDGANELYQAPLIDGGGSFLARVLGEGDVVPGGALSPFELQAFDRDASGLLAFQAVFDASQQFASFLQEDGVSTNIAQRFDVIPDLGTVQAVRQRLALAGRGRVAHGVITTDGTDALLLRVPPPIEPPAGGAARLQEEGPVTSVLAATGRPAPDGGRYLSFQSSRATARLASDGQGLLALAAATDAGPQEIALFDLDPNLPPVADAGSDRIVECAGPAGTTVTLDGLASSDPDGDPVTYLWAGPFGTASGATPSVVLPLGLSTVTLVVSDGSLTSGPDTMTVEVRDGLPPTITVQAQPDRIWPPDGRMVSVFFLVAAADVCDPDPDVVLASVVIEDPKGSDPGDIAGAAIGEDDRSIDVRAKRSGGSPRRYVATFGVTDQSGNSASASAFAQVPSSGGR